ncbi:hypothetical protein Dimus_021332 [Dionaea muscipula]
MEGGSVEDIGAPESWEAADVEESMKRLMLSSSSSATLRKDYSASASSTSSSYPSYSSSSSCIALPAELDGSALGLADFPSSSGAGAAKNGSGGSFSEDVINQVDEFLREALQNPRERLSILRMEQDVEKFIRDPTQQQLEFQQLPTSYLRLAAHRVAQHYFLQSMVLSDNNLPDGSGSRILVQKTSTECQLPLIRLADIPVNLPRDDNGVVKVAIKQRPQKRSPIMSSSGPNSSKANQLKSVEERKEEYNRARARIFSASNHSGSSDMKFKNDSRTDSLQHGYVGVSKVEEKTTPGSSDLSTRRGVTDSSAGSSRSSRSRTEKEPAVRYRPNNRVAIFRDREVDRKDPDYDRSYERYVQRFDPGFGFNTGLYAVQPMYMPALNYNTEFPQLGAAHRPQISAELQPRPLPQHMPGPWTSPSNPTGIGYGHPETIMTGYDPNHVSARSTSALYLHSTQYPCQRPLPFIHPHEHIHQPFSQSHQQQHDATLALARPR